MKESDHDTQVGGQLLDIERPSGGGGLIGMGGMAIWGGIWEPGAPGGRGGPGIPPGGGGGIFSFGGRGPPPLIRGGGRFTPAGGGGPLDWVTDFSILKWNWRKNWEKKITWKTVNPHISCFQIKYPGWLCGNKTLISTCLVSLFQWVQKRFSALSISLLGT